MLATATPLCATDYYVDQSLPTARDQNAGTEERPWKTLTKANQTLKAGDTVFIKAGTYRTCIAPANSGTPGARITYRNVGNNVVTIAGASYAIYLNGRNHITVQGIRATDCVHFLYLINGARYNIIANCSFDRQKPTDWDASVINGNSQYNWIHHCRFSKGGGCTAGGSDHGSVLDIGIERGSTDLTQYNLIEDCMFFHGGHHVVGLYGRYNTFRNNYLHNEAWSRSRGNRNLYLNGKDTVTGYNTIEGNRFGYAARPCDDYTVGNVAISTPYNLFRYNKLYHHNAYGIGTYSYRGYSNGSYNRIYNNTIFNSGYNVYPSYKHGSEDTAVAFMAPSNTGNVLKNNLYYSNYQLYTGSTGHQTYAHEFNGDRMGDPKFVNAGTTPPADKMDATLPNLDLRSLSPAIDAGGALTTVAITDTGSGTSLMLADARHFQDGRYGPPGIIQADWIAVGAVRNVVQILSIDYPTNTITLAKSVGRNANDPVWLYKKSDGERVLYGSAPDSGASEFRPTKIPRRSNRNWTIGNFPDNHNSSEPNAE